MNGIENSYAINDLSNRRIAIAEHYIQALRLKNISS